MNKDLQINLVKMTTKLHSDMSNFTTDLEEQKEKIAEFKAILNQYYSDK